MGKARATRAGLVPNGGWNVAASPGSLLECRCDSQELQQHLRKLSESIPLDILNSRSWAYLVLVLLWSLLSKATCGKPGRLSLQTLPLPMARQSESQSLKDNCLCVSYIGASWLRFWHLPNVNYDHHILGWAASYLNLEKHWTWRKGGWGFISGHQCSMDMGNSRPRPHKVYAVHIKPELNLA